VELNYDDLTRLMLTEVPEARLGYERERRWWGREKPGAHVLFGNVMVPILINALDSGTQADLLQRAFRFVEHLAGHQSQAIREIASQSILEPLADEKNRIMRARPYFGPQTLRLVNDIGDL
jgi:hypothetical protein